MIDISEKKPSTDLEKAKNTVSGAHDYFRKNYEAWHKSRNFLFRTQLSRKNKGLLKKLNKPDLQFNILAPYISKLRGEFSKQEPSIQVSRQEDVPMTPNIGAQIEIAEGHTRHILNEANKNGCEYNVYTDQLSGGFSVLKVWTEYASPMSFQQVIKMDRVYDPTLCGFDPMARLSHKGDGRFCFEMYPKSEAEFKEENPDIDLSGISFDREMGGFNWSYKTEREKVLLVCDYYEKKKKQITILQLANEANEVIEEKEYKKLLNEWHAALIVAPPPAIKNKRKTEVTTICRTRFIENKILEYVETDYKHLPLVFVDGNSVLLRKTPKSGVQQYTKCYFQDAIGAQKLKNFAGQSLAGYIENMVSHKWKVALESIVEDYKDWIQNPQVATAAVYRAFHNNDPEKPIPPPQEIGLIPMPAEISNAFQMADQTVQSILGSFDASIANLSKNDLSGKAIVEAQTLSNSAAMPYIVSFLQALNQCAEIILDLIPKYNIEARNIAIVDKEGNRSEASINDPYNPKSVSMKYPENSLQVKVEAGVNFGIQKNRALNSMIGMMQASPQFSQFMNDEGLPELLDNMEFRGVDILKEKAKAWMQMQKQKQAMQAKMAQEAAANDPRAILAKAKMVDAQSTMAKTQHQIEHSLIEDKQVAADQAIQEQKYENERLAILADIDDSQRSALVKEEQMQTESMVQAVKASVEISKHRESVHSDKAHHHRENIGMMHKMLTDHLKLAQGDKLRENA